MTQKIIKSGHSLAVTLPSQFVKSLGVKKGDDVRVERRIDRGQLILRFKGAQQLRLNES